MPTDRQHLEDARRFLAFQAEIAPLLRLQTDLWRLTYPVWTLHADGSFTMQVRWLSAEAQAQHDAIDQTIRAMAQDYGVHYA